MSQLNLKTKKRLKQVKIQFLYISPEQTGRINIKLDLRSDLYSLGCVFYEMITDSTPFYDDKVSNMINNHISKKPSIPAQYKEIQFEVIWKIIFKLLNKNSDDRYLSIHSLLKDLNKCLDMFRNTNTIQDFKLDTSFGSNQFKISDKVFGRNNEINEISDYIKLSEESRAKLLLVSGDSGIGKTSLIDEVGKLIKNDSCYFLDGKFDININKPYSVFIEVFTKYVKEKISEKDELLTEFKNNVIKFLGNNYDALINLVPSIDMIFDNKNLKNFQIIDEKTCYSVFQKFIEAILYTDKNLTIFIDDFQWADEASIKLIKHLLNSIKSNQLSIMIAFRPNELNNNAKEAVHTFKNGEVEFKELQVKPISQLNISNILIESFKFYEEEVKELSNVIFDKTGGSPFFVIQFIKLLYNNGILIFDMENGRWIFNINETRNINCTDNTVSFVLENIKKLSRKTIDLMILASCIGDNFDLKLLAEVSNQSLADTYIELIPAVNDKFLTMDSGYYKLIEFSDICKGNVIFRFSHDRIREALYKINSNEEKLKKHLAIGEILVKNELYIVEGVKHINIGLENLDNQNDLTKYVKLNYEAGKIALHKAAYADAYVFFTKANKLLNDNAWEEEPDLAFNINLELLKMEFIRKKDLNKADELFDTLMVHAKDINDKHRIYEIKIKYTISMSEIDKAEKYTSEYLNMIGIDFNFNPSKEEVRIEKEKFLKKIPKDNIKMLYDLPRMKNKVIESVLDILCELQAIEYSFKPLAYEMLIYKVIELSLEYGNCGASCLAYCSYGVILIKNHKLIDEGYEFGKLAYELIDQLNEYYYKARIALSYGFCINIHKNNGKNSLKYFKSAEKLFSEQGNTPNVGYAIVGLAQIKTACGENLKDIYYELQENLYKSEEINFKPIVLFITELMDYVKVLRGMSNHKEKIVDCVDKEEVTVVNGNPYINFINYTVRARSQYMFGDYKESVESSRGAEKLAWMFVSEFQYINHYFYYSLALVKLYYEAEGDDKKIT